MKMPALCLRLILLILLQLQQHTNVVLSQKLLETLGIASPQTPNTVQACPPLTCTTTTTEILQTPLSPTTSVQSYPPQTPVTYDKCPVVSTADTSVTYSKCTVISTDKCAVISTDKCAVISTADTCVFYHKCALTFTADTCVACSKHAN